MKLNPLISALIVLCGCSSVSDIETSVITNETTCDISNNISPTEAIEIGNIFLKKENTSRNFTDSNVSVTAILSTNSRSVESNDTVAYIINYGNNEGFSIISSDNRVYPVLAFSDKGNFSLDNQIAKTNFIDKIDAYIQANVTSEPHYVTENDLDGCYAIEPIIQTSIGQGYPWNKYVTKDHPGCPAGCVAVATALVLAHSQKEIITPLFSPNYFNCKSIMEKLKNEPKYEGDIPPSAEWKKTYEEAIDSMAMFIYEIGKSVGTTYSKGGSSALSRDAYNLCKQLTAQPPTIYISYYEDKIYEYLKDDHIIYVRGPEVSANLGGHAWVIDGGYFCYSNGISGQIQKGFLHCDWGWGGESNGYFNGAIFELFDMAFRPDDYFAIKREWKFYKYQL